MLEEGGREGGPKKVEGRLHRLEQARRLRKGEKGIIIISKTGASVSQTFHSARARRFGGPASYPSLL